MICNFCKLDTNHPYHNIHSSNHCRVFVTIQIRLNIIFNLCSINRTFTAYPFNIRKIPTDFSKNSKRWGPQVRIMPRHKLEVIKLLIATEPVKTVIYNVLAVKNSRKHAKFTAVIRPMPSKTTCYTWTVAFITSL